ncbi:MAG: hypothetical protein M1812_005944 [Candelaria pacifica]|nr:MAG: hypothetical protein M1812_005944 [Candelaria pacifica]
MAISKASIWYLAFLTVSTVEASPVPVDVTILDASNTISPTSRDVNIKKRDANNPLLTDSQFYGTTEPLQCVGTPDNQPSTTQDYALTKISVFCKYVAGASITSTADYIPGGYRAGHDQPWWGNDLWVSISWNPECPGKELKVLQNDCERLLGRTIKDCKDSPEKKYGGTVFGDCGVYDVLVRNANDVTPPKGKLLSLLAGNPQPGWDGNV